MKQINPFQNRVVKNKKVGKDAILQISVNDITRRIFIDFASIDGRLKVQRSFQDTFEGKKEAKQFEKQFKSLSDLKKYFGVSNG